MPLISLSHTPVNKTNFLHCRAFLLSCATFKCGDLTSSHVIKLDSSNVENTIEILCQLFARVLTHLKKWIIHNSWRNSREPARFVLVVSSVSCCSTRLTTKKTCRFQDFPSTLMSLTAVLLRGDVNLPIVVLRPYWRNVKAQSTQNLNSTEISCKYIFLLSSLMELQ